MNFAVFASGYGSNLQAIINAVKKKKIKANLVVVISDREDSLALRRARKAHIEGLFIDPMGFKDKDAYDTEIIKHLEEKNVEFIVLAGFMRILSVQMISKFENRILNVHPSLLPAFKGAHAIKDAFTYGVKVTGVTIHLVEFKIDAGPIIFQEAIEISPRDTLKKLEEKIHRIEHRLYPKAIDLLARGKIKVRGRNVVVK